MDSFGGLDATFALVTGFAVLFILFVAGAVLFAIVKGVRQTATNNAAPEVSAAAQIVDKRIETRGGGDNSVSQHHFVSFEQPGGERFELEVPGTEYGLLVAGDRGSVTMRGTQYLGFAREVLR